MSLRVADLSSRALIRIAGPEWRGFLQGLISNDVEQLGAGRQRFAALLTPQGRLLYDMFVVGRDEGCLLDVAATGREALLQRLQMYRLRAKVEIAAVAGTVSALWADPAAGVASDWSPEDPAWITDPRLPSLGWRGVDAAPPTEARSGDESAYDAFRLGLGLPDPTRDCLTDKTYPIEADFDLLNGIDFNKGCYVGQETTSRMKRRGGVRSRMLPITFDGAPPAFGAEVLAGSLRAGEVLSGGDGRAMALLRLDRIRGAELSAAGRSVKVAIPAWIRPSLPD